MRMRNEKVSLHIAFPYSKPDANGNMYNKEAIISAMHRMYTERLPIIFVDKDGLERIVGATEDDVDPMWSDENGYICFRVYGTIFAGGTSCIVNKRSNDGVVEDFEITSIGISEI